MAVYAFAEKIQRREPIEVYGEGRMARDFTYIDDIVDGVLGVLDRPPPRHAHEIYNIGNANPVGLLAMIHMLEAAMGVDASMIMKPMQPGDVTATCADVRKISALAGYQPQVRLEEGLGRFVSWWREYAREPASARGQVR
jgi:UDP-glucuronate 4-epimerase